MCQFQTISLEAHQRHISTQHKYIEDHLKRRLKDEGNGHQKETHESIRKRMNKIDKSECTVKKKNPNHTMVVQRNGVTYDVIVN